MPSLDSEDVDTDDPKSTREQAAQNFLDKIDFVGAVTDIGHGPKYVNYITNLTDKGFPYPGKVGFLLMTRMSGGDMDDVFLELKGEELEDIR